MEYVLDSGAKLSVTQAPFINAMALYKALLASVKGLQLAEDVMNMDVTVLKDAAISAATSPEVEQALYKCARRATYNTFPVDPSLFDDPRIGTQAREDFYEIAWRVVEVNCGPFFKRTFLRLKGALAGITSSPESK